MGLDDVDNPGPGMVRLCCPHFGCRWYSDLTREQALIMHGKLPDYPNEAASKRARFVAKAADAHLLDHRMRGPVPGL